MAGLDFAFSLSYNYCTTGLRSSPIDLFPFRVEYPTEQDPESDFLSESIRLKGRLSIAILFSFLFFSFSCDYELAIGMKLLLSELKLGPGRLSRGQLCLPDELV